MSDSEVASWPDLVVFGMAGLCGNLGGLLMSGVYLTPPRTGVEWFTGLLLLVISMIGVAWLAAGWESEQ